MFLDVFKKAKKLIAVEPGTKEELRKPGNLAEFLKPRHFVDQSSRFPAATIGHARLIYEFTVKDSNVTEYISVGGHLTGFVRQCLPQHLVHLRPGSAGSVA